jgi:hypothetical protein
MMTNFLRTDSGEMVPLHLLDAPVTPIHDEQGNVTGYQMSYKNRSATISQADWLLAAFPVIPAETDWFWIRLIRNPDGSPKEFDRIAIIAWLIGPELSPTAITPFGRLEQSPGWIMSPDGKVRSKSEQFASLDDLWRSLFPEGPER